MWLQQGDKDTRLKPCNQRLARHKPPIMSVWCLPCNTGHPKQNYQVHTTGMHTNYRHQMQATLPLVVGVIFFPPTFFILILCQFALHRDSPANSRSKTFPIMLSLSNTQKLTLKPSQASQDSDSVFIFLCG